MKVVKLLPLAAFAVLVMFTAMGETASAEESGSGISFFQSVFEVELDGEQIGTVDDKAVIEAYINDRLDEFEQKHEGVKAVSTTSVEYIEHDRLFSTYDNDAAIEKLDDQLVIRAQAVKLVVGNERIGLFKSQEKAEQLMRQYETQFVPVETIERFEQLQQQSEENTTQSQSESDEDNGDDVLNISLSKEVSYEQEIVGLEDFSTLEEGLDKLNAGMVQEKTHTIEKGDVLGTIADEYELSNDELLELNPEIDEDTLLQVGDELIVTEYVPFLTITLTEQLSEEQEIDYETETKESDSLEKGKTKVEQEGEKGLKEVTYNVTTQNGEVTKREVVREKVIEEPVKKIVVKGTKVSDRGTGNLRWPTVGGYISSYKGQRWGRQHKGIDIARPSNRSILAADNGRIASAGWNSGGYGNRIVIDHNNGIRTIYAHLSSISVSVGQKVSKGDKIGVMGRTGHATGVHLHFEVYKNGGLQNPTRYLN